MGNARILFIESDSNRHLGLFADLGDLSDVDIMTFPNHVNVGRKLLTRMSPSFSFLTAAGKRNLGHYEKVVVVDTALSRMNAAVLERLKRIGDELFVILLNSLGASSPSFQRAKGLLSLVQSDHVFTFDKVEAEQFGFSFLGLSYYSIHRLNLCGLKRDVYFAGGLKGGREHEIVALCNWLEDNGLKVLFECVNVGGVKLLDSLPSGLKIVSKRWVPYERVLDGVAQSKCIVELLQHGQNAQSLRYFEAVCYNKNLLTNNPMIFDLPYYDPNHMFYFDSIEDIDCARIADADLPDYGYQGEFSPTKLELLE